MSDRSGISWTDATWSPVTGCSPVSEGCQFERDALQCAVLGGES